MTVRIGTTSTPRAASLRTSPPKSGPSSPESSRAPSRVVPAVAPSGAPSAGRGYQLSRTVPAAVRVASPAATAERRSVTGATLPRPTRRCLRPPVGSAVVGTAPHLDLTADVLELTRVLVDTPSVSGDETALADAVEIALRGLGGLEVERLGNAVLARTELGRDTRVVLAGHLDTVPIADNVPSHEENGLLNGLGRVARERRSWLYGDLAVLLEPTDGEIEAGCQGTMRAVLSFKGRRAHSARSWLGENAIHGAADALATLAAYRAREVEIDGCTYREGLNAVRIEGGVAGNVIPDLATVEINFRYAPDRDEDAAETHVRQVFADAIDRGATLTVMDNAGGALPGLHEPAAAAFVVAVGRPARAKLGWTDVARFAAFGIPAVNYGPGDPQLAHTRDEHVPVGRLQPAEDALIAYLSGSSA